MPVEDEKLPEVFGRLRSMLVEQNMGWVVEQVLEEIRSGKPPRRAAKVSGRPRPVFSEEPPDYPPRRSAAATFLASEEYSQRERVLLLLGAFEQAVVRLAEIEENVNSRFPGVSFISDDGEEKLILHPRTPARQRSVATLHRLLSRLKDEVDTHAS
jgi:hypothetical protein